MLLQGMGPLVLVIGFALMIVVIRVVEARTDPMRRTRRRASTTVGTIVRRLARGPAGRFWRWANTSR